MRNRDDSSGVMPDYDDVMANVRECADGGIEHALERARECSARSNECVQMAVLSYTELITQMQYKARDRDLAHAVEDGDDVIDLCIAVVALLRSI